MFKFYLYESSGLGVNSKTFVRTIMFSFLFSIAILQSNKRICSCGLLQQETCERSKIQKAARPS